MPSLPCRRSAAAPASCPAVSSLCGSADVLEALGVAVEVGPQGVVQCLEQAGVGFMYAPTFHPAMKVRPPPARPCPGPAPPAPAIS